MRDYPSAPEGWTAVSHRSVGRFTTSVTYERPDGSRLEWSSRWHRKHASQLSRVRDGGRLRERVLWAPHRASWWIAVLFMLGSTCFVIAPIPAYLEWVGASADGVTFFVGSLFFTSAAALQWLETINADRGPATPAGRSTRVLAWEPARVDWWSSAVQLVGTLFFNVTTFRALTTATDTSSYDQVVWTPDALGSVCFLVSGYLAYVEVADGLFKRPAGTVEGAVVSVNLFGCVAFAVSAVAAYVRPSTDALVNATVTNAATGVGALAFFIGAALLLPEGAKATTSPREG